MAASEVGEDESGSFEVATWRVVTLFLVIVAIDTAWEFFDEFVTHGLQKRMQMGLMRAWEQLKFETMALGLISLLLVAGEEQLLKICINSPDDDKDEYATDAGHDAYAAAGDPHTDDHADDHHRRRLMASAGGNPCPEGKEPIWESELIHKAHILIFLIAACHIVYAMVSIALSMLAMRRWHKFEQRVKGGQLLPLPLGGLQKHGEPALVFGLRQCLRQFTNPIDIATYSALRALFVDRVEVGADFDFAAMIQEYLTEEFARVVRFDLVMWCIAIIWMVFPEGSYGGFWMTGGFTLLSLAAGAKLTSAAMHLSRHAYGLYYEPPPRPPPPPPAAPRELERSMGALMPGASVSSSSDGKMSQDDTTAAGAEVSAAGPVAESVKASDTLDDNTAGGILPSAAAAGDNPSPTRALRRAIRGHSQRIKAPSGATDGDCELLDLFWFRRPRLVLHVFRYAFFQNAIAIAAVIFGFWQDEKTVFGGAVKGYDNTVRAVAYLLLFFVLLLLVHTSMILFPLYALTAGTAEFGSPQGVLDFARRRGIRPDLVRFLEETAPSAKAASTAAPAKGKAKCSIAGAAKAHHQPIPEHPDSSDGDDDDYNALPVALTAFDSDAEAAAAAAGDAGPQALLAASAASSRLGAGSALARPPAASSGGTSPAVGDSGSVGGSGRPQPVALAHAYSDSAVPMLSTQPTAHGLSALHSDANHSTADGHGDAPHGGGHSHAPGMAATVQGLLEGMAARRAEALASRMRRPRR